MKSLISIIALFICLTPTVILPQNWNAVLAGVNDYPGNINDLQWCVNDVTVMRQYLINYKQWSNNNINLITDSDAEESDIQTAMQAMSTSTGNTNLFHFSGHGDSEELGEIWNYDGMDGLIPSNSMDARITQDELQVAFGSNYNQCTAFLDACGTGIFPRDMTIGVISSACEAGEVAGESSGLEHGVFTYYLLSGLTQSTINTAEQLHNYASPLTQTYTSQYQNPQLGDNFEGYLSIYNATYTLSGTISRSETWSSATTLSGNIYVPSNKTLTITEDLILDLNGYSIVSTGGSIITQSGATINTSNSHTRLVTGSTINGLYPTITSALSGIDIGQTIEIYGPHTLTTNYSIPTGLSLSVKSGAILTLGSYSIVSSGGTITVASGVTLSPDARRVSGSTILGLYPSISSALSAASSGQTVEYGGSHTLSSNLTVASGKTLTAKAGSTLSFGSGYYLSVSGTLNAYGTSASRATFTRSGSSGTWGGIRYQSASSGTLSYGAISYGTYGVYLNSSNPDIDHCNISSCSNGIYCTGCSPDITYNSISGSSTGISCISASPNISNNSISGGTGIYVYNGSPNIITNSLSNSNLSMNACDSYMYDNYFSGGSGSYACYLYASSPTLLYNTITTTSALLTIYPNTGSDPWFGDVNPDNGYNYLSNSNDNDGVLWASDNSNPLLGYAGAGLYYGGYNSIIGGEGVYPVAAVDGTSSIDADYCWWGQYPAPTCYGDVSTAYALQSDPGGGSSLAKKSFIPARESELASDLLTADSLYKVGMNLFFEKQYEAAVSIFKSIIIDYPGTGYASKALSRAMWVGRKYEKLDRLALLDELLDQTDNKNLTAALKGRQVLLYRQTGEIEKAVKLSQEILSENPDSVRECTALFDLFNLYQKDLGDSVTAGEYLSVLKTKYPDDDHTLMARSDCGEDVTGIISKRHTIPTAEPQAAPFAVLPSEFSLNPAQPNPFNMTTNISFDLPEETGVEIVVYDLMGREVWKSAKTHYSAGTYSVIWNGTNHSGQPVGTGMYLVRLNSAKYNATQKVLLMK